MLGHGRISFETPNVIDEGDAVPETPSRSLRSDFANRGSVTRVSITSDDDDRRIYKPSLSRSIKINYEDDADDEPADLLMPVNLDPEYGDNYDGESKEELRVQGGPGSPTMEQTRLFAAAMLSESDRRGGSRLIGNIKSPVKNLFGNRKNRKDHYLGDGLGLDYPSSVMDKWRTDRRRRCRYAVVLLLSAITIFTAFGLFMNMHADEYGDRMVATSEFLNANEISTQQALVDRNSPQYKAARWIANQDAERLDIPETSEDPYRFIQRYAVAVLYYSLGGDNWTSQLNFLSDDHECSWNDEIADENNELYAVGVSCGPKLHIESLLARKSCHFTT
jgi:hypothetical protein